MSGGERSAGVSGQLGKGLGVMAPVVNGLRPFDFYAINRALRKGHPLTGTCGAFLDWEGWRSQGEFVEAVSRLFFEAWRSGALGAKAGSTAYRGITVTEDVLSQFLRERLIVDLGYGFATPCRDLALFHLHEDQRTEKGVYAEDGGAKPVSVLLEITVGRYPLYCPSGSEPDPFGIRPIEGMASTAKAGEFVFDRGALLRITAVDLTSSPDVLVCEHRI
ncbi:hypothetical protein KZX15_07905 [Micrococcus luteus]|uniref:hypothetical protein n=2 Tax=Micrococcus TaxID=1269 RepID=UPI00200430F9|nr:hypothetical protein [Micrococcus luteus]MCK6214291.1 hypothetical protein [Micrococcus luteus]